jgi:hypothetical protein
VAIAIGFMVGSAIRTATGDRGGLRFQVLAVVLTYWAVGLAYTPFVFKEMGQSQDVQVSPASTEGASAEEEASTEAAAGEAAPAEPAAADDAVESVPAVVAFGFLLALSFALPVLSAVGSLPGGLISAAIIAFGMMQAWRMTGAPHLVISGPYRIARKLAS